MAHLGPGELLRLKLRLVAPLLNAATARFWDHSRLPELFPVFLETLYGSVAATVPLMRAALDALEPQAAPLDSMLAEYFSRHIIEETGHDEWLLQDLEALGIDRRRVGRIPPPPIARLVGAQYYWIRHAHPVSLLGFFAVLEGHPPTREQIEDVQRRSAAPPAAFRMLARHALEDPAHADDLFRLADDLPLDLWHVELIGTSAFETVRALCEVFDWLATRPAAAASAAPP